MHRARIAGDEPPASSARGREEGCQVAQTLLADPVAECALLRETPSDLAAELDLGGTGDKQHAVSSIQERSSEVHPALERPRANVPVRGQVQDVACTSATRRGAIRLVELEELLATSDLRWS